jgi:hypothetical protein
VPKKQTGQRRAEASERSSRYIPPIVSRSDGVSFVVKLTSRIGGVCWLSAPNAEGFRTLGTRENAGLFPRYEDANLAIRKLPEAFKVIGRIFSVETTN